MVELPVDLREEDRVLEAERIGGRAGFELIAVQVQDPALRLRVASDVPAAACSDTHLHLDKREAQGVAAVVAPAFVPRCVGEFGRVDHGMLLRAHWLLRLVLLMPRAPALGLKVPNTQRPTWSLCFPVGSIGCLGCE
ncbi:hypothetical protein [Paucibacter sp. M5-1]|uniref:hypothetical protein n=1 Tax=Paucibacter sp. M5-1 TaxID=3015998 RepID=UPI003F7D409C